MSRTPRRKKSTGFGKVTPKRRPSLPAEFWSFLKHNKKWWLLPIVIVLLFLSLILLIGGTAAAPFLYTLF